MAQIAYNGKIMIHPSKAIEVYGTTEAGREIKIYLTQDSIDTLREIMVFAHDYCDHLGHSFWHIRNNRPTPCDQCRKER